ncbi:MAG TPA: MarR family transcriptional regulator [Polyangiaceae bacterium]|nr:MarR family transcriptional regulator [Polyangiaceae bacterium]
MPLPNLRDYRALAELRYQIRLFLSFSEGAARASGIEPQQHQLLLACKGLPLGSRPTIGTLAARLCLEHNTVVQLIDKLERHGYVTRERSPENRREVLVTLTPSAESVLAHLSVLHREQLRNAGPALHEAIGAILGSLEKPKRGRGG